jgi:phenylacetate-CoA ligase
MSAVMRRAPGCAGLLFGNHWTRERVEAFQVRRLRVLLRHACDHVPHYRRLFARAGFDPERVHTLADLAAIPMTCRDDLQGAPAMETVAEGLDPAKLVLHRTSGSSGQPLDIRRTWFEEHLLQASRLRVLGAFGFRLTDRRAAVVLARHESPTWYGRLGLLPYEEVHCLLPPGEVLSSLRAIRPDILRGYPGTLSWLAGFLTPEDRASIRPRFIATESETLTSDMRARIGEGFGAPVIDFYGSHEFNLIAWECPAGGCYHFSDLTVIAEILKDGRPAEPGEEGELVATALHSFGMPFIRFRLGDQVVRGEARCSCGAPNSTLARVAGRVMDRFALRNGRSVHPYTLINPLLQCAPWLRRYQIVQEDLERLLVKLVPLAGKSPTADDFAGLRQAMVDNLGTSVSVRFEVVDEIPASANGKFRPYYSLVRRGSDGAPGIHAPVR